MAATRKNTIKTASVKVGKIRIGGGAPLCIIAGPCVIESKHSALSHAKQIKRVSEVTGIPFIFKASYDKANRTSVDSYRGPGLKKGLDILHDIKQKVGVPVLSDVHSPEEAVAAAEVLDILQIPAFLCRQTDLLVEAGRTNKVINIKKMQTLTAGDMKHAVDKVKSTGNKQILLTERGMSFGYKNLVSDFRSLIQMRELGVPVVFDATHSVQQPGGLGGKSGGDRRFAPPLARAACAVGVDAIFMEVHANPDKALSDGPNSLPLSCLKGLWTGLNKLDRLRREIV